MMRSRLHLIAALAMALVAGGCGSDDNGGTGPAASRTIRYEMSGTYSGSLLVGYTSASGGNATATVTSLPWSLDVTYLPSVTAIVISPNELGFSAANSGKTLTVRVLAGGQQVRTQTATGNSMGVVGFGAVSYVFP
jgi:ABC-type glycerol-3-phosphate transport system substrate-binding protein